MYAIYKHTRKFCVLQYIEDLQPDSSLTSFYGPPSLMGKQSDRCWSKEKDSLPVFYLHVTVWGGPVVHLGAIIAMAKIKYNFIGFQQRKRDGIHG